MKRRWRHAQRHGCNVWLPRCCPWGIPTTLLGLLACPSLNRDPYAAHYPSCEVVSGVNEIMRIIMITHSFEATRSKIDEFPLAGSLCYQWFSNLKDSKESYARSVQIDIALLLLLLLLLHWSSLQEVSLFQVHHRRCWRWNPKPHADPTGQVAGMQSLENAMAPPKTPSAKSGTFSKQWTFTGVQIYTGHARTPCCGKLLPSS